MTLEIDSILKQKKTLSSQNVIHQLICRYLFSDDFCAIFKFATLYERHQIDKKKLKNYLDKKFVKIDFDCTSKRSKVWHIAVIKIIHHKFTAVVLHERLNLHAVSIE